MQLTVPGKANLIFRLLTESDYPKLQTFCDYFKEQNLKNNDSFQSLKIDKMKMPYGQYFIGYDTDKDCIWNISGIHHLPEIHEHAYRAYFRNAILPGYRMGDMLTRDLFKLSYTTSYILGMQIEFILKHDIQAEIFASSNNSNAKPFGRSQYIDVVIAPALGKRGVCSKAYDNFILFNTPQSIWKLNIDKYYSERLKSVGF
jgi:hypothetical protein